MNRPAIPSRTGPLEDFATEESRWRALVERNRRAEGAFFYAVKTTGVYCRPGCSSRLPKREHVEFFADGAAAGQAGYRPCQRCRPDAVSPGERQAAVIARACQQIEEAPEPPTLDQLAAAAQLSPHHFHRLFKATVGVTPKQYAAACRMSRFQDRLKNEGSITAAIYDAGFGSSSRAYAGAASRLGMTPSAYKSGAAGLVIRFAAAPCFLGWVLVAASERGLCAIALGDSPDTLQAQLQSRFPSARLQPAEAGFAAWIEQVIAFIESPERGLGLPLDIQGTAFQQRVWAALQAIPPGATASYAELARRIGAPNATRAAARACALNPLAVVIPCHRVVRSDGQLSGYRWGVERKRALLEREAASAKKK